MRLRGCEGRAGEGKTRVNGAKSHEGCFATTTGKRHKSDDFYFWTLRGRDNGLMQAR